MKKTKTKGSADTGKAEANAKLASQQLRQAFTEEYDQIRAESDVVVESLPPEEVLKRERKQAQLHIAAIKAMVQVGRTEEEQIEDEKRRILKMWPTPMELAHLASSIGRKQGSVINDDKALAHRAHELWQACVGHLDDEAERLARIEVPKRLKQAAERERPKPATFPATLDDVLRCFDAGRNKDERFAMYQEYIQFSVAKAGLTPQYEIEAIVSRIVNDSLEKGIVDESGFRLLRPRFLKWKAERRERLQRERAAKGGRAAAKKV